MCKYIDGATPDCKFKIHNMKCPKGHPLHLSSGKTFLCCRSGCNYIELINKENLQEVNSQINGKLLQFKK